MRSFEGKFSRSNLPEGDHIKSGWIAVSHMHIRDKKERRNSRGVWYKIENKGTGKHTYRILKFSPTLESHTTEGPAGVVMDWDGWLEVNNFSEDLPEKATLNFRPCNRWEQFKAAWFHPDRSYRLARRIAIILGLTSLVLGSISLIVSAGCVQ